MRPEITTEGIEAYECLTCGARTTGVDSRECSDCGGTLRHLGKARDL
ncbi:rubrerythrin-like domain-containing protein [Halostella sp. JP-L12]|nr:rubrerythrin-like domain-containing protein [Halostella sp. JP-L12]